MCLVRMRVKVSQSARHDVVSQMTEHTFVCTMDRSLDLSAAGNIGCRRNGHWSTSRFPPSSIRNRLDIGSVPTKRSTNPLVITGFERADKHSSSCSLAPGDSVLDVESVDTEQWNVFKSPPSALHIHIRGDSDSVDGTDDEDAR